jgi:hypothetical protein
MSLNHGHLFSVAFPGQSKNSEIIRPQLEVLAEGLDSQREDGVLTIARILFFVNFRKILLLRR